MALLNQTQNPNSSQHNTPTTNPLPIHTPNKPKKTGLILPVLLALSLGTNLVQVISNNKSPDKFVKALGSIDEKQEHQGTIAYLITTKEGNKTVVYGNKGSDILFYGRAYQGQTQDVLFSALQNKTGTTDPSPADVSHSTSANTSGHLAHNQGGDSPYLAFGQNDMTPAQAVGAYKGEIPQVFEVLDKMSGFKENPSITPENTVYIIYDPRCPYCHEFFEDSRHLNLKDKNITLKWLPTNALGESPDALKLATAGLRAKSSEDFAKSLGKVGEAIGADNPTDAEKQAIDANFQLLLQAHEQAFANSQTNPSVPATFFLDKRTGEPRLIYGISIPEIRKTILGE